MKRNKPHTPETFWDLVEKTAGCWEWKGTIVGPMGYGQIRYKTKITKAHRLAYEFAHGQIPSGLCVCHTCNNPKCVNPSHLFLGTISENNIDRHNKGRTPKGEAAGSAILTEKQVIEIRQKYNPPNITYETLSVEYGVARNTIAQIIFGATWKHVSGIRKWEKSFCKNGHPINETNTRIYSWRGKTTKQCRVCERAKYHRKKQIIAELEGGER